MSLFPKAITEYLALVGIPRGKYSNIFIVDPANGSDTNPGTNFIQPLASIAAAYEKCVANQHDVVLYLAGSSGNNLAEALVWSKNFTHLVGLCAPSHVGQRSRIFQEADLTGASPLVTLSATGCIFRDLYVFQGVDDATSLINVKLTGGRNFLYNVHFAGGGHASQAINGGASCLIEGGSENTFERCTFGVDTVDAGDGMAALVFAATGGAARNLFKDCKFTLQAGHAGAVFVELLGNSGLDRYQIFENCLFSNLSGTAMTQAFAVAAGFDPANKRVLLKDCALIGATDWDANDRGILYLNSGTITGGGNAGLFAVSAAT